MVFGIGRDPGPDPDPGRDPGFRSRNRDPVRALLLNNVFVFGFLAKNDFFIFL